MTKETGEQDPNKAAVDSLFAPSADDGDGMDSSNIPLTDVLQQLSGGKL